MIFAHVSQTPLAGAAWAAAEAFREAGHDSFCIAPEDYGNGRRMATHYRYPPVGGAAARLTAADAIFCHQGWPYQQRWYPRGKPTIGWYHSSPTADQIDRKLESDGWPWGVTGGYEARLHPGCTALPELYPLKHRFYRVREKPAGRVRIAYSPPDAYPATGAGNHRETVLASLAGLDADVDVIVGLSLEEDLRRKAVAHVVIDDCITGAYNRASLDGLALGCVVVNNCDRLCAWNVQRMSGGCGHPFTLSGPGRLRQTLRELIACGPQTLAHLGRRNRRWFEAAWSPAALIARNFQPLIDAALDNARGRAAGGQHAPQERIGSP